MWTGTPPVVKTRFTPEDMPDAGRLHGDLDVFLYLVQNMKLAETIEIDSNVRVRMPYRPLAGERRARVEQVVTEASRDRLPAV